MTCLDSLVLRCNKYEGKTCLCQAGEKAGIIYFKYEKNLQYVKQT